MERLTRHELQTLPRDALQAWQLERLNKLLAVAQDQPFYRERLAAVQLPLATLQDITQLPLIGKRDLIADERGQPGRIFGLTRSSYSRLHQTSGTRGWPMPVLDTADDWAWWMACWAYVLDAAEVSADDVALMAFSFGPFIGFWSANDALVQRGAMVVPGGGMSSEARLQLIADHGCTLVCCTPTYALHLASVARQSGIDLTTNSVSRIIVAGEPGGSVPTIRRRIEQSWGARVIDHSGASEVGAWGVGSQDGQGIYVIESEFIAELLRFDEETPNGRPVDDGEEAELVLTNLGRLGGPAIRYRTGDIVRGYRNHEHACRFLWLEGGVLGRADDMLVIRGVNIFPSSVEAIIRELDATAEFRVIATCKDEMEQLAVEIEATPDTANRLRERFRDRLAMRVPVTTVDLGTLPRFEAKAKRWIDRRQEASSYPAP